jgi:hypothetical protein
MTENYTYNMAYKCSCGKQGSLQYIVPYIKLMDLPNGLLKSADPSDSGEVIDINFGGLTAPNMATPVVDTDGANKVYVDDGDENSVKAPNNLVQHHLISGLDGALEVYSTDVTVTPATNNVSAASFNSVPLSASQGNAYYLDGSGNYVTNLIADSYSGVSLSTTQGSDYYLAGDGDYYLLPDDQYNVTSDLVLSANHIPIGVGTGRKIEDSVATVSNLSGSVTAVTDYAETIEGTIKIAVPDVYSLVAGDTLILENMTTTGYNGSYLIAEVNNTYQDNYFVIPSEYGGDSTGEWTSNIANLDVPAIQGVSLQTSSPTSAYLNGAGTYVSDLVADSYGGVALSTSAGLGYYLSGNGEYSTHLTAETYNGITLTTVMPDNYYLSGDGNYYELPVDEESVTSDLTLTANHLTIGVGTGRKIEDSVATISNLFGSVTAVTDHSSVISGTIKIAVPDVYSMVAGDTLILENMTTTGYDGSYLITEVNNEYQDNYFIIPGTYQSASTGEWTSNIANLAVPAIQGVRLQTSSPTSAYLNGAATYVSDLVADSYSGVALSTSAGIGHYLNGNGQYVNHLVADSYSGVVLSTLHGNTYYLDGAGNYVTDLTATSYGGVALSTSAGSGYYLNGNGEYVNHLTASSYGGVALSTSKGSGHYLNGNGEYETALTATSYGGVELTTHAGADHYLSGYGDYRTNLTAASYSGVELTTHAGSVYYLNGDGQYATDLVAGSYSGVTLSTSAGSGHYLAGNGHYVANLTAASYGGVALSTSTGDTYYLDGAGNYVTDLTATSYGGVALSTSTGAAYYLNGVGNYVNHLVAASYSGVALSTSQGSSHYLGGDGNYHATADNTNNVTSSAALTVNYIPVATGSNRAVIDSDATISSSLTGTITAVSDNSSSISGTVKLETANVYSSVVGDTITLSGMSISSYDGTYTIAAIFNIYQDNHFVIHSTYHGTSTGNWSVNRANFSAPSIHGVVLKSGLPTTSYLNGQGKYDTPVASGEIFIGHKNLAGSDITSMDKYEGTLITGRGRKLIEVLRRQKQYDTISLTATLNDNKHIEISQNMGSAKNSRMTINGDSRIIHVGTKEGLSHDVRVDNDHVNGSVLSFSNTNVRFSKQLPSKTVTDSSKTYNKLMVHLSDSIDDLSINEVDIPINFGDSSGRIALAIKRTINTPWTEIIEIKSRPRNGDHMKFPISNLAIIFWNASSPKPSLKESILVPIYVEFDKNDELSSIIDKTITAINSSHAAIPYWRDLGLPELLDDDYCYFMRG